MISPESPSAEHRPPGTPASRNTSQGQSPLDSLYKQIDQEMGWELTGDQWKRPGTTVNERLNQARIFLSDEDVNTSLSFEIHHKRIDNYLRKLAEEEVECDVNVYNEVQCMLRVHKTRIDKQKHLNLNFFEHVPAARLSQRLSLGELDDRTAITGGPLQDDNPHFSTQRPPNLSLFLKNLHDDTTLGQKLRKLEGQGYQEVIKNPSVVNEVLEVRESMNQHKMFDIQARKRGRRRAAIQIALQSFATNDEQHYQGSWQHNVLRLPFKQLGKRPEAVLTIGTGGENEEHHTPPYRWTKRYLAFLKHQKSPLHGGAKERTLQELAQPLSEMQQVFSEHRAVELIEDAILTELHENRDPSKSKHTHDWTLLAESLDLDGTIDYFAPRRWQPAHEEPDVLEATTRKRQAEEALETESSPKRGHFAVDYSPLGGPGNSPSRRLPLEELGFQAHREDSRDHTPDIGAGGLMPREMQQFNYQRDKMALENVLDKLEKHYSGAASFMFGETGYLSALMSREVASVLAARKRESALEQGHYIGPGPPSPPPPLVLPSERFSLPPLEHTEGFQGRFPPPSCSVDQIFSRKASPPPSQILLANPKMVQLSPPPPSSPTLAVPKSNSFPQKPTVLTSPQSSVPKPGPYIPTRPTPAPPRPFVARPESSSQNRPAPSPTKLTVHRPSPASPKRSSSSPIPPRVRKSRDDFTVSEMPPPRRLRPKLPPPAPFRPSIGLDPPTPFATSKLRLEYIISSKGQLSSRRLL